MSERRVSTVGTLGRRLLLAGVIMTCASCESTSPNVIGQDNSPVAITVQSSSPWFSAEIQLATNSPFPSSLPTEMPSPTVSPTPDIAVTPQPVFVPESKVLSEVNTGLGSEPTVAASPYEPNLMAVTHQRVAFKDGCDLSGIRISQDGGKTWTEVSQEPWHGGCPDFHGQVVWGPGPDSGSSRLWYVNAMIVGTHQVSPGVTYSDDLGKTWAPMHIETRTPSWVGGFPDITVDNNQKSPNFGAVYVAYNWLESDKGPGLAVIASRDNGVSWNIAQVPAVKLDDYPYDWRIGYRIKTAPDGSAYVSFYESLLKSWNSEGTNIFNQGGSSNIGALGFAIARLHFDPIPNLTPYGAEHFNYNFTADPAVWMTSVSENLDLPIDPEWQTGLDIDDLGQVWIAVSNDGKIDIGHTDDKLESSFWLSLGLDGQSVFKPSLAVSGEMVFVGFHGMDNCGMVRTYYIISYDKGETFSSPQLVTPYAWSWSLIGNLTNNVGLRENATSAVDANGNPVFVYGFGVARNGQPNVDVAVIDPGFQRNTSNDDLGMRN